MPIFPAILLMASGCSGINASKSVSPASFFVPGLMQADPTVRSQEEPDTACEPAKQLAQNR